MSSFVRFVVTGTRASPERCRLLAALHEQPLSVDRLVTTAGLSREAVERHLDVLCANGIVVTRSVALETQYELTDAIEADRGLSERLFGAAD